ncbi:MAG: YihY/virulence factor BrkB family protein, partial [Megasphaera sp.]|nr:YihY/virulence factor BrkB family protein [Megasphaera sp.]
SVVMKGIAYLPPEVSTVLVDNIHRVVEARSSAWLLVGLLIAFWAAAQGMQVLVQASDQTFHEDRNKQNWFRVKLKSMIFMLFLTFSILASLALMVFGNALIYAVHHIVYLPVFFLQLWTLIKYALSFSSLIVTLTMFYHFAPYAFRPKWKRSFLISIFVTILWFSVTAVYSYYMLNISNMGLTYGSLIGIIALFIWFRLIAMAIIAGSEILMAWQDFDVLRQHRHPIQPDKKCIPSP